MKQKKPNPKEKQVGRKAFIVVGKMKFEVVIKKYEFSFGHDRYLVEPVSGTGQAVVQTLSNFHD